MKEKKLNSFRVTVHGPGLAIEEFTVLAASSVDAAVQTMQIMADDDDCSSQSFSITVFPMLTLVRRAA